VVMPCARSWKISRSRGVKHGLGCDFKPMGAAREGPDPLYVVVVDIEERGVRTADQPKPVWRSTPGSVTVECSSISDSMINQPS
jgi:hypothetical protein